MLVPKLVTALKTYNREQFVADLTAAIVVGIVQKFGVDVPGSPAPSL